MFIKSRKDFPAITALLGTSRLLNFGKFSYHHVYLDHHIYQNQSNYYYIQGNFQIQSAPDDVKVSGVSNFERYFHDCNFVK